MSSVSKAQHGFMGLARAVKEGKTKPSEVRPGIRKKITSAASSMSREQLRDYTATRTGGLPRHASGTMPAGKPRAARSA